MTLVSSRRLLIATVVALPSLAFAGQVNWDSDKPYDYDLADTSAKSVCGDVNKTFGTDGSIACVIDHASFDKHLATQLKIPKYKDRDYDDVYGYCIEGVFQSLSAPNDMPARDFRGNCAKARPEIAKSVKRVLCRYQEGQSTATVPKVELEHDGTLVFNVFHGSNLLHGFGWIVTGMRKLFPAYDACMTAHE